VVPCTQRTSNWLDVFAESGIEWNIVLYSQGVPHTYSPRGFFLFRLCFVKIQILHPVRRNSTYFLCVSTLIIAVLSTPFFLFAIVCISPPSQPVTPGIIFGPFHTSGTPSIDVPFQPLSSRWSSPSEPCEVPVAVDSSSSSFPLVSISTSISM